MDSIRSIAVIGAGKAGRSFALRCIRAGMPVVLEDVLPSKLRLAREQAAYSLGESGDALRFASTVEDAVRDVDVAIDFMPDDLESKLEMFSMLDRMAPPRTVLCTPTERLSLTDLASCTYRAERCIGLRGDADSGEISLVHGRLTAAEVVEATAEWLRRLGYEVSLLEDREEPMLVKNLRTEP